MQYEIIPCVDGDAEYIEEQADQATNAIAPPAEGVQEEVFIRVAFWAGVFWLQKNGRPR